MIKLGVILHKLINSQVVMNALAHNLHKKSSIIVVVANHKTWLAYHCMLDHIVSLLILTCLN